MVCSLDCGEGELRADRDFVPGVSDNGYAEQVEPLPAAAAHLVVPTSGRADEPGPPAPTRVEEPRTSVASVGRQPTSGAAEVTATSSTQAAASTSHTPAGDVEVAPEAAAPPLPPPLPLKEPLYLTGAWAKWATNLAAGKLIQVPAPEGFARLRLCVKMTSQSFSFQVVSADRGWKWRLYPRDAKNLKFTHVSKEGKLSPGDPDAVVVALGDLKAGHGLNFHVLESDGAIVTVWLEVPVRSTGDALVLKDDSPAGYRVWYTLEDTGVQYTGGDGIDLNKYSSWVKF